MENHHFKASGRVGLPAKSNRDLDLHFFPPSSDEDVWSYSGKLLFKELDLKKKNHFQCHLLHFDLFSVI
jgi:hypothetical protein